MSWEFPGRNWGLCLSAFFYTYALLQIPAGWLVDRFDVKWVFALGLFIWSAATAVTGVLHGFVALLAIRVVSRRGRIRGLSRVWQDSWWTFQRREAWVRQLGDYRRSGPRPRGWNAAGRKLCWALRMALVLCDLGASRIAVARAMVGVDAAQSAFFACISDQRSGVLAILRQRSAWGTCVCQFSFNYASYFLVTWLPFYLMRARGLSMTQMAKAGGFVYVLLRFRRLSLESCRTAG